MKTWRLVKGLKGLLTALTVVIVFGGMAVLNTADDASAQETPECSSWSYEGYTQTECKTLTSQTYSDQEWVTTSSCQLGWSHREASQPITVTETYFTSTYTWEVWVTDDSTGEQVHYETWTVPEDHVLVSSTTDAGQCTPIKGRPPQN